jgi:hypothetical protein
MDEQLDKLTALQNEYPVSKERSAVLERIDVQATEIFKCSESNCRKI